MKPRSAHTLITWLPSSDDGMNCAKALHKLYKLNLVLKRPEHLSKLELGYYKCLIVVGHRSELCIDRTFYSLADSLMNSGCPWLVLANYDSGISNRVKTLEDHELLSPAQRLSLQCNIKVSGTKRPLLFTEVSEGTAFTLTNFEFLIRANPPGEDLWVDFEKCNELDLITEGVSNL
ncbi:hypothetical protein [Vibrio coralliilyticus]|uniref:hypothetical protein n=1 Tax=Vibrio coralliilyticus TaxID=190893 RepID=UPI001D0D5C25|nr:hypothetical protein [Vibrio coralliilyticus]